MACFVVFSLFLLLCHIRSRVPAFLRIKALLSSFLSCVSVEELTILQNPFIVSKANQKCQGGGFYFKKLFWVPENMGWNHCQVHLACCPTRSLTCSFHSPQSTCGSDKPAGTGVGRNMYPILWLGSWAAQIRDWKRQCWNQCAESPSWSPGERAVHILSAASVCSFEEGSLHLLREGPHCYPCWGSAHAPTQQDTFQLRISHGNSGLLTHGEQQYHLLC